VDGQVKTLRGGWLFEAIAPSMKKRAKRSFAARDIAGVTKALEQLNAQAENAGFAPTQAALASKAGRDGFWIARGLARIDVDLLLTTLVGWLRGSRPKRMRTCTNPAVAVVRWSRIGSGSRTGSAVC
jgi:hypothetical protein